VNQALGDLADASDSLSVTGQIDVEADAVRSSFRAARGVDELAPLLRHDGNFLLVYRRGDDVFIVNSLYSLNNYFYREGHGEFRHGSTIHSMGQGAGVAFTWNLEAVANLMALEHVIDNETLVDGVEAIPMGAILHWDGRRLNKRVYSWQEFAAPAPRSGPAVAQRLVDLLLRGISAGAGAHPILTASSGLDSRVNLAALLHLGLKPELAVMGEPKAKDVEIVKAMGSALGLAVNHIVPEARDYIDGAAEICRLTNGVKPLNHWHTFVIAAKSGYGQSDRVLTGNNGEHVRAVGFDYGALAQGLDLLSRADRGAASHLLLRKYWALKSWVLLSSDELRQCAPEFAAYYGSPRQLDRFMSVMPRSSFGWQSDTFILEQRRKGFQSAGLQLFRSRFPVYSPFLNKCWIDAGWSLPLGWRLGSYWHRQAVARLFPRLMDFPEEKEAERMLRRPRPLHWAPLVKKLYRRPAARPYVDYGTLLRRDDVLALLHDHANQLDGLVPRRLVDRIIDDQRRTGARGRLVSILTGMAVWRASLG
jgi:asparagine synthase (glutamine-hydrolysing)